MSMQAYLAEKYMSGPKADAILARAGTGKKKKRKAAVDGTAAPSVGIVDNDLTGFAGLHPDEDDDSAAPVVASDRGFKKRRTAPDAAAAKAEVDAGWTTVRDGIKEETPPLAADEQPQVVDAPFKGGLLSRHQVARALPSVASSSRAMTKEEEAAAQETVYRDASGRKIDTKAEKAEAARKKREREEKEARKLQWGKGVVQRDEAEETRKRLEKMKTTAFARTVDDADLNAAQKDADRWNDPAAQFLSKKKSKGPRRPEYTGPPPPPNRFGIKPGYRWDGVDRSTGFEQKLFQRMNERKRTGAESYSWGTEDM